MKLGVSISAFREKWVIPIIEQYREVADKIVVTVSNKPWFGDFSPDDTYERAKSTGVEVYDVDFPIESDQRNFSMSKLQDCDYIIISHCDTFFTKESLLEAKKQLSFQTGLHYGCNTYTYWKDFSHVIFPEIVLPTLFVRKDAHFINSIDIEGLRAQVQKLNGVVCHHISWVKSDEEILSKISSYWHAPEINKNWYKDVWQNSSMDIENFGPTVPEDFQKIIKFNLPKEIREKLI